MFTDVHFCFSKENFNPDHAKSLRLLTPGFFSITQKVYHKPQICNSVQCITYCGMLTRNLQCINQQESNQEICIALGAMAAFNVMTINSPVYDTPGSCNSVVYHTSSCCTGKNEETRRCMTHLGAATLQCIIHPVVAIPRCIIQNRPKV